MEYPILISYITRNKEKTIWFIQTINTSSSLFRPRFHINLNHAPSSQCLRRWFSTLFIANDHFPAEMFNLIVDAYATIITGEIEDTHSNTKQKNYMENYHSLSNYYDNSLLVGFAFLCVRSFVFSANSALFLSMSHSIRICVFLGLITILLGDLVNCAYGKSSYYRLYYIVESFFCVQRQDS